MDTTPPAGTEMEFPWDEETHSKFAHLVCFLRQLDHMHDSEEADDNDDLESNSSLEVLPETDIFPLPETSLQQTLVDAIAFVATVERTAEHVVAVALETLDGGRCVRFRISMNGNIPETMLSGLKEFGALLTKINTENTEYAESEAQRHLFDLIVRLKKRNLATFLRGGLGPPGLLTLFEDARRNVTLLGKVRYPSHSEALKISAEEFEANGIYNADTHEKHMEAAWSYFNKLHDLCKKSANKGKGRKASRSSINIEAVKELILLAFKGRHSKCFSYLMTLGDETASTKLHASLRKLSRYWQCSLDLVKCARSEDFAGLFGNIEFCAIPKLPATPPPFASPGTEDLLNKFLISLGYGDGELAKYCDETNQRMKDIEAEFRQLAKKELYVHAEIGLIFFYGAHPELSPAPYIGCSKYACFLCNTFIKHHPYFRIRDTHKKVYVGWGLPDPEVCRWPSDLIETTHKTMRDIEKAARLAFFESPRKRKPAFLPPESTSGVSKTIVGSPAPQDDKTPPNTRRRPTIDEVLGLSMDRYFAAATNESDEYDISSSLQNMNLNDTASTSANQSEDRGECHGKCHGCDEITTRRCSKCGNKYYCSTRCEKEMERTHIFSCSPGRPLDSADYLARYCIKDELPENDLVEGFGFDRCSNAHEASHLFGLYIGLVLYLNVSTRSLHRWQQENSLAENICKTYEEAGALSGYYKWFLNNKHLVDANTPKKSPIAASLDLDALQKYLPTQDRGIDIKDLQPESKKEVAVLYASLRSGYRPCPAMEMWLNFGFCTCKGEWGQDGEQGLADFYKNLFDKCSFEEFWKAYERRSLGKLSKDKGLGEKLKVLENKGILVGLPRAHPSCYELKQYVLVGDPNIQPPRPAGVDYGFWKCVSAKERQLWRETYRRLFEHYNHDDRELHKACISGKIYQYAKRLLPDIPPEFERMSFNDYPLRGGVSSATAWRFKEPKTVFEMQGLAADNVVLIFK